MAHQAWNVYLRGKKIDTVFCSRGDNLLGFDAWCADFGYDTDSRKAEKTFKACEHQAARLKTFLESSLYQ